MPVFFPTAAEARALQVEQLSELHARPLFGAVKFGCSEVTRYRKKTKQAMENEPGLKMIFPIDNGDIPLLCWFTLPENKLVRGVIVAIENWHI